MAEYEGAGSFWQQLAGGTFGGQDDFAVISGSSKTLDSLLDSSKLNLEELLLQDLIEEFRWGNARLVEKLSNPLEIANLIELLISMPPEDGSDDRKFKVPFMACELLLCEVDDFTDRVVARSSLAEVPSGVQKLLSFLDISQIPCNPVLAGYFSRVLSFLLQRRSSLVASSIREYSSPEKFLKFFGSFSVADCFALLMENDVFPEFDISDMCSSVVVSDEFAEENFFHVCDILLKSRKEKFLKQICSQKMIDFLLSRESPSFLKILSAVLVRAFDISKEDMNYWGGRDDGDDDIIDKVSFSDKLSFDEGGGGSSSFNFSDGKRKRQSQSSIGYVRNLSNLLTKSDKTNLVFRSASEDSLYSAALLELLLNLLKFVFLSEQESCPENIPYEFVSEIFWKFPASSYIHCFVSEIVHVLTEDRKIEKFARHFIPRMIETENARNFHEKQNCNISAIKNILYEVFSSLPTLCEGFEGWEIAGKSLALEFPKISRKLADLPTSPSLRHVMIIDMPVSGSSSNSSADFSPRTSPTAVDWKASWDDDEDDGSGILK